MKNISSKDLLEVANWLDPNHAQQSVDSTSLDNVIDFLKFSAERFSDSEVGINKNLIQSMLKGVLILNKLVRLKILKDNGFKHEGDKEFYDLAKPIVWEEAKNLLEVGNEDSLVMFRVMILLDIIK